jgi:hypothetical protein
MTDDGILVPLGLARRLLSGDITARGDLADLMEHGERYRIPKPKRDTPQGPRTFGKGVIKWLGDEGTAPDGSSYAINSETHGNHIGAGWAYWGMFVDAQGFSHDLPYWAVSEGRETRQHARNCCERHYRDKDKHR